MHLLQLDLEMLTTAMLVALYLHLDEREDIIYEAKGPNASAPYSETTREIARELLFRQPQNTLSKILIANS